MTDKDIERRLADALAKSAPDDVEDVMSRCRSSVSGDSKGTVIPLNMAEKNTNVNNTVKKKNIWKGMAAACLAVMIVGGGSLYGYQSHAVASVVSLDVNPSIELKVNSREKVISCEELNEEGKDVLSDMDNGKDLKGTKLDVAVNAIVGGLVKNGYFDSISSAILISVEDNDTTRADRLQKQLYNTVNSVLNDSSHTADVLSQTLSQDSALEAQAKSNNISTGKAALIEQIMKLNGSLKFEALSALSVEELKDLRDVGAPGMPIGRSAAASAAVKYAGASSTTDIVVETDAELDDAVPCYEVEIKHASLGEFEYKIDAYSGKVISGVSGALSGSASGTSSAAASSKSQTSSAAQPAGTAASSHHNDQHHSSSGTSHHTATGTAGSASSAASANIGESKARSIALSHAGVSSSAVHELESELDHEDGQLVYEIEFKSGNMEYEYIINAATGAVVKYGSEYDD